MTFEKDITKYPELTDENPVAVTLANEEWGVVIDWLSHFPYEQSRAVLEKFRDQTSAIKEEDYEQPFTAVLTVSEFNRVIGSLSLAPYYVVAELITKIHSQAVKEIGEWRNLYNTMREPTPESAEATE